MTNGSYLLARFEDRGRLVPAVQTLQQIEPISRWDAVDGDISLVIKTSSADSSVIDSITNLEGISELHRCEIIEENETGVTVDEADGLAYAFIEVETNKSSSIKQAISAIDGVDSCPTTNGHCDLIVLVKGEGFDIVDRIIKYEIRLLDGVLRLKENRVINLEHL
jgi:nitrate reductase NapAB chaperone NapD